MKIQITYSSLEDKEKEIKNTIINYLNEKKEKGEILFCLNEENEENEENKEKELNDEWISSYKQLPKDNQLVIVFYNRKYMTIAFYNREHEIWTLQNGDLMVNGLNITYWMALPPIPNLNGFKKGE